MEESLPRPLELAATTTSQPKHERERVCESAVDRVVGDLRNAFDDVPGVGVVAFRISEDGAQMEPFPPAGRADRPGPFVRGTERGDKAFAVLSGDKSYVTVPNLPCSLGWRSWSASPRPSEDRSG